MKPIFPSDMTAKQISNNPNKQVINSFTSKFDVKCHCCVFRESQQWVCGEKCQQHKTIFSALSGLFPDYSWKYSNTIIGTFFALMAASPWKQLQSLAPWGLILNTSRLSEMGKMGRAWNPTLLFHLRDVGDVWVLVFVTGIMGSASFALHSQKR